LRIIDDSHPGKSDNIPRHAIQRIDPISPLPQRRNRLRSKPPPPGLIDQRPRTPLCIRAKNEFAAAKNHDAARKNDNAAAQQSMQRVSLRCAAENSDSTTAQLRGARAIEGSARRMLPQIPQNCSAVRVYDFFCGAGKTFSGRIINFA